MRLRRGHLAALRGLLTMPAIFCCFILLLAPLAGTVEGATVNMAGTWDVTMSGITTGCQDPENNETGSIESVMTITQSGVNIQGTIQLVFPDAVDQVTITGTIGSNGWLSGIFSGTSSIGWQYSGSFSGWVTDSTFSLQYSGRVTVGERCNLSGSLLGTRQIADTVTITSGPTAIPGTVLVPGGTVSLSVTATDSLSHRLSFSWIASCTDLPSNGSFSDTITQNPTWKAPANMTGTTKSCTLTVTASDVGFGHTDTKSVTVTVNS